MRVGTWNLAGRWTPAHEELLRAQTCPDGDLVWGGDWNHSLVGAERAGSDAGRLAVRSAVRARGLQVPTAEQPHQLPDCGSIDHVAVPVSWSATASRVGAAGLSDHDAYVVDVAPSTR